jgi:hypothetical protein
MCLCLQDCLQSLLAAGTVLPDGSAAHISVGNRQSKATWQQGQGRWALAQVSAEDTAGGAVGQMSVKYVDRPVARLTSLRASNRESSMHRISLLVQSTYVGRTLHFEGSDQTSAPPEQPEDRDDMVVSCIARGSWGTCLPVTVAGVEEAADTMTDDGSSGSDVALVVSAGCLANGSATISNVHQFLQDAEPLFD